MLCCAMGLTNIIEVSSLSYKCPIRLKLTIGDVEAEIDPVLRYGENKKNILAKIKRNTERYYAQHLDDESLSFEKDQARDFHDQRSEKSRQMDESISAATIIDDREITKNPNVVNRWYKTPNRLDIEGVDDY